VEGVVMKLNLNRVERYDLDSSKDNVEWQAVVVMVCNELSGSIKAGNFLTI
jgi:hypothetical protein